MRQPQSNVSNPSADQVHPARRHSLQRWRSYPGVSWGAAAHSKDAPKFAESVNTPICGIHFDEKARAFVSTPRFISAKAPATLSILDTDAQTGPARLQAFPSVEGNAVTASPDQHLRSVLGFYVDNRNGWLWALDQGYVAGESDSPSGAQKVMVYDLQTGKTVKRISLDEAADRRGSFLNDIVVDEARKIGYISDSGLRSAPDNQVGIIVVDFASGTARRILHKHPTLQVVPGVRVHSHGAEVWPGNPLKLGINGIALSPDGGTLYWSVTTGRHAYALPTEALHSNRANEAELAALIRDIGDVGGNTDGIVTDASGTLYLTDLTHGGIVTYDPRTQAMSLAASDDGVHWPDTATVHPDGDLIFTSSNLSQHFAAAIRPGEERFELWRLRVGAGAHIETT